MAVKYVASLNEVEQDAIVVMVLNVAQEMFLDEEETNEAVQNALDSKVDDLSDLLEMNGVSSLDEAVEKFASSYSKIVTDLAQEFNGACDVFENRDMIVSFDNDNEIEVAIRENIAKVYASNEECYHDEIYTDVEVFEKALRHLMKVSKDVSY